MWQGENDAPLDSSAMDILQREDISANDKLWLVLRPQLLGDVFITAVHNFAARVLPIYEFYSNDDTRLRDCLDVVQRSISGNATKDELRAATKIARDVATTATRAAAKAATAVLHATYTAFYVARMKMTTDDAIRAECIANASADAYGVAYNAAWTVVYISSEAARAVAEEMDAQVQHLVDLLEYHALVNKK